MEVNIKLINTTNLIHPVLKVKFDQIFKEFKERTGHHICIVETYRDKKRQQFLYDQGRTSSGKVVTNTMASFHRIGLAIDVCGDIDPEKRGRQDPYNINWPLLGSIVISHDLVWGGYWGDSCHIEMRGNYTTGQIWEMIEDEGLLYVWQRLNSYYGFN